MKRAICRMASAVVAAALLFIAPNYTLANPANLTKNADTSVIIDMTWLNELQFWGNKPKFEKKIVKEFDINAKGKIAATGKYGNMNISTWNKNKVRFEVKIVVKADNKKKADELFERIFIDFDNNKNYAAADYRVENSNKRNWWGSSYTSYEVHYDIKIPATASVRLQNKYGAIHMTDIKGTANIENKYGNVRTGDAGNVELMLGYGKADLGKVGNVNVEIKYSKLDIEAAKNVVIESKYSRMYIDKADEIKSESKYDKYFLGEIASLRTYGKYDDFEIRSIKEIQADGKYSDYDIKVLHGTAAFDMKYGDAEIRKTTSTMRSIKFEGQYADLIVDMKGNGGTFDIQSEYGSIKMPENAVIQDHQKHGTEQHMKGKIGNGNAKIFANVNYGSVQIY